MNPDTYAHLNELKKHVLHAVIGYLILAVTAAIFAKPIFHQFAQPLIQQLPNEQLIATGVASPFFTPLKFSLLLALGLALPWFLYQAWQFVAPGLFQQEKRLGITALVFSTLLFYAGVAFAYWLVMPLALGFFVHSAPAGVVVMTDLNAYFDFAIKLLLAFGLAFETPLIVCLIVKLRLVDVATLRKQRGYVVVGAFAVGMLLTPPDIFSQTLLAVPLWLLFEVGLWLASSSSSLRGA